MIDLDLQDGDLVLATGQGAEFEVTDDEIPLVRRALQTPIGRIAIPEWGADNFIRDEEFGNEIYSEMSEPFGPSYLETARQHCQRAAELVSNRIRVERTSLQMNSPNEIFLFVQHDQDTDPLFLDLS